MYHRTVPWYNASFGTTAAIFPGHPARAELQSLLTWGTIEPMKNQASTKVILFMLLLYLIWGFNWVVMRV
ncbi:MAG: hypothetical protein Q4F96_06130, partial [Bacillota bacterium]|nr:hypothetical protein [Bacillota bacterium]